MGFFLYSRVCGALGRHTESQKTIKPVFLRWAFLYSRVCGALGRHTESQQKVLLHRKGFFYSTTQHLQTFYIKPVNIKEYEQAF
jgi:hypothetical protein